MGTRRWKCGDCNAVVEFSYDWVAEHGGPYCPNCDIDMFLVPLDDEIDDLMHKAHAANLGDQDFAGEAVEVVDVAIKGMLRCLAGGIDSQIDCLVRLIGPEKTAVALRRAAKAKPKTKPEEKVVLPAHHDLED